MTVPPRDAHVDRFGWGARQPYEAARLVLSDPELLRESLHPALLLALVCAGVAICTTLPGWSTVTRFYNVFLALAPWPSILLARHYARLAVLAHRKLGLGEAQPVYEPIGRAIRRALGQAVLIAIAVAPVSFFLGWIPLFGTVVVKVTAAVWALHWVLVNAFESGRVLLPGQTIEELDRIARETTAPWFVRGLYRLGERAPAIGGPCRWFANLCDRLAWPWREEMAIIEQHLTLTGGFALTTFALLATPVLNLLFRPVVLVASVRVLSLVDESQIPSLPASGEAEAQG
jgi:hypothetical protein